jgi:hypothetical protein
MRTRPASFGIAQLGRGGALPGLSHPRENCPAGLCPALPALQPPREAGAEKAAARPLLIEDFSGEASVLGRDWHFLTDAVMGGLSTGTARITREDGQRAMTIEGEVRLEGGGGFIQARLDLASRGKPLDATGYSGLRLLAKGGREGYYAFLRSAGCGLPWRYYEAFLPLDEEWASLDLPFEAFRPKGFGPGGPEGGAALDPSTLLSFGFVAGRTAFHARAWLAGLWLY